MSRKFIWSGLSGAVGFYAEVPTILIPEEPILPTWHTVIHPWANDGTITTLWDSENTRYYDEFGGGVLRLVVPISTPTFSKLRVTRSGIIGGPTPSLRTNYSEFIEYDPSLDTIVTLELVQNLNPDDYFTLYGSQYIDDIEIYY